MIANKSETSDEMAIRHLVENWARAVRSKNLKGILANHSPAAAWRDPPRQSTDCQDRITLSETEVGRHQTPLAGC